MKHGEPGEATFALQSPTPLCAYPSARQKEGSTRHAPHTHTHPAAQDLLSPAPSPPPPPRPRPSPANTHTQSYLKGGSGKGFGVSDLFALLLAVHTEEVRLVGDVVARVRHRGRGDGDAHHHLGSGLGLQRVAGAGVADQRRVRQVEAVQSHLRAHT